LCLSTEKTQRGARRESKAGLYRPRDEDQLVGAQPPDTNLLFAHSALLVLQATAGDVPATLADHADARGGILIGKRLAPDTFLVVAAVEPGPAPDNQQLGFAL